MNFAVVEKLFWPFVLVVGTRITLIDDTLKKKFWRDHAIMCSLVTLPASVLDWFTTGIPVVVFPTLVALGGTAYIAFICKWRKHLNRHLCSKGDK